MWENRLPRKLDESEVSKVKTETKSNGKEHRHLHRDRTLETTVQAEISYKLRNLEMDLKDDE